MVFSIKIYEIIKTADGSPTLACISHGSAGHTHPSRKEFPKEVGFQKKENMHSLHGAFSESLYVYGSCIEKSIKSVSAISHTFSKDFQLPPIKLHTRKPRILSLGLGLGYNELIAHGFLLKEKKSRFSLISFEKESDLVLSFKAWLKGENFLSTPILHKRSNSHGCFSDSRSFTFGKPDFSDKTRLNQCYDEILKRVSEHFEESPEKLKEFCYQNFKRGVFQILGNLPKKNPFDFGFTGILYDPFSNQSDPKLWTTDHLINFIKSYCDPKECFFASYAATSDLKRVLKSQGFNPIRKKGFTGKRESTLAFRRLWSPID